MADDTDLPGTEAAQQYMQGWNEVSGSVNAGYDAATPADYRQMGMQDRRAAIAGGRDPGPMAQPPARRWSAA